MEAVRHYSRQSVPIAAGHRLVICTLAAASCRNNQLAPFGVALARALCTTSHVLTTCCSAWVNCGVTISLVSRRPSSKCLCKPCGVDAPSGANGRSGRLYLQGHSVQEFLPLLQPDRLPTRPISLQAPRITSACMCCFEAPFEPSALQRARGHHASWCRATFSGHHGS